MKNYDKQKELIKRCIENLEAEIDEFSNERLKKIFKYEQQLKVLEEEQIKELDKFREEFVEKIVAFKKSPNDKVMKELLDDLHAIKLSDMQYEEQFKMVKSIQPLFEYIYAKEDVALLEKYLLAKNSAGAVALRKLKPQIDEYKQHMEKGVYTHTDKSKYVMDGYCIFAYEIQEFMKLLGKMDYQTKPKEFDGVYRSEEFEKYMLRAVAGAYGYWSQYLYADGEFGHKDYERECFEKLHDESYQQEQQKSSDLAL